MTEWKLCPEQRYVRSPRRLTEARWNRSAAALWSLMSLPGEFMGDEARRLRLDALAAADVAKTMARHEMGGRLSEGAIEMATWMLDDLMARLGPV